MNVTLRNYEAADFETLVAVDQACFDPQVAYSAREFRAYLRLPGAAVLMAEAAGKTAGFIVTAHGKAEGHVITLDILAEFRRNKIGSKLLAAAEERLAASGVRRVCLETASNNHGAIAFWEKHGYRTRGILQNYYPGGRDALAMCKPLGTRSRQRIVEEA